MTERVIAAIYAVLPSRRRSTTKGPAKILNADHDGAIHRCSPARCERDFGLLGGWDPDATFQLNAGAVDIDDETALERRAEDHWKYV